MNNSEAAFMLSSVMEFIHVWRIGNESSLALECKDGRASINFHCNLGRPDQAHIQDGRQGHKKKKKKSANRVLKNNARAARYQALSRSSPPVSPEQYFIFAPPAPPGTVTSPVSQTSSSSYQPPDELREEIKTQTDDYDEPAHAEEETGRQQDSKSIKSDSSQDSSGESESEDSSENLPDSTMEFLVDSQNVDILFNEWEHVYVNFRNLDRNEQEMIVNKWEMWLNKLSRSSLGDLDNLLLDGIKQDLSEVKMIYFKE